MKWVRDEWGNSQRTLVSQVGWTISMYKWGDKEWVAELLDEFTKCWTKTQRNVSITLFFFHFILFQLSLSLLFNLHKPSCGCLYICVNLSTYMCVKLECQWRMSWNSLVDKAMDKMGGRFCAKEKNDCFHYYKTLKVEKGWK